MPMPRTWAEAAAIAKATVRTSALEFGCAHLEKIMLWIVDLTDAYRMLGVQRAELYMQAFAWDDGLRYDSRCQFGTAQMVQYFQRVSSFVLRVADYRIDRVDALFPYSYPRQAMLARRQHELGGRQRVPYSSIFIDDAYGTVVVDPQTPQRPELHVAEVRVTAVEAGWIIQEPKVHIAEQIDGLGAAIDSRRGRAARGRHAAAGGGRDVDRPPRPRGSGGA